MDSDTYAGVRTLFWHRRDLRLEDNVGLSAALRTRGDVLPIFIFDKTILDPLEDRDDARVTFIYERVREMAEKLAGWGSGLYAVYADPVDFYMDVKNRFPDLEAVFTNNDYEPSAKKRDATVRKLLAEQGIDFLSFKDQVIFEGREIVTAQGKAFSVYTPYSRRWREAFTPSMTDFHPVEEYKDAFAKQINLPAIPSLADMGFTQSHIVPHPTKIEPDDLKAYERLRNLPGEDGTTRLSVHLRFGTFSIRQAVYMGRQYSDKWLSELIWRDFYMQVLDNFPATMNTSFKPEYDHIRWRNDEGEFNKWCDGQTGYAIVDAGMRQLNTEGWMHNRVRMVTASFLSKHLLIDWRWGEAYFARKLLDYDMAANVGGWQWAAGSGVDAAPYFRVFNPQLQQEKFDPEFIYIAKYVPEYQTEAYKNSVIVEHTVARARALDAYGKAVKKTNPSAAPA